MMKENEHRFLEQDLVRLEDNGADGIATAFRNDVGRRLRYEHRGLLIAPLPPKMIRLLHLLGRPQE